MALKIIFMGTPQFSVPILKALHNSIHEIIEVYTQPPKKKDRGQKLNFTPVYDYSNQNKISVRYPEILNSDEEINFIKNTKPDVVVVVAYGKIIPTEMLNLKNIKFINVHASLLPKWRGAAPIQRSIMNQDIETGISIMKIVPKLDSGPILMKSKVSISKDTNSEILSKTLSDLGSTMIIKSLSLIENGSDDFVEQNENDATYAKKINKSEAKINWQESAEKNIAKINALYPSPGTWFNFKGSRLKIIKAIEVNKSGKPGEVLDEKFTIACSKNAIQILELQKEGKKKANINEFLKGNTIKIGFNVC